MVDFDITLERNEYAGAIEFVQAQGVKKRTEIRPKYKEKIEWNKKQVITVVLLHSRCTFLKR